MVWMLRVMLSHRPVTRSMPMTIRSAPPKSWMPRWWRRRKADTVPKRSYPAAMSRNGTPSPSEYAIARMIPRATAESFAVAVARIDGAQRGTGARCPAEPEHGTEHGGARQPRRRAAVDAHLALAADADEDQAHEDDEDTAHAHEHRAVLHEG